MSWGDIWKIILATFASVGGVAGMLIISVKFTSNIIAERLAQKYEIKLQKDLEEYKSNLSKKEYVSKTKFNTEFSLYRELSSAFVEMVQAVSTLIPAGFVIVPVDHKERLALDSEHYKVAVTKVSKAQSTLYENIPFISEKINDGYAEILKLAKLQLAEYEDRFVVTDLGQKEEKDGFSREAYKRTYEMGEKWKIINNTIRDYISKLDVVEDK